MLGTQKHSNLHLLIATTISVANVNLCCKSEAEFAGDNEKPKKTTSPNRNVDDGSYASPAKTETDGETAPRTDRWPTKAFDDLTDDCRKCYKEVVSQLERLERLAPPDVKVRVFFEEYLPGDATRIGGNPYDCHLNLGTKSKDGVGVTGTPCPCLCQTEIPPPYAEGLTKRPR